MLGRIEPPAGRPFPSSTAPLRPPRNLQQEELGMVTLPPADPIHRGVRRAAERGVTLLELMVVVAIIGILSALTIASVARGRPRARLDEAAKGLQASLGEARQRAMASGRDVVVAFYARTVTSKGTGRLVVYFDGAGGFASGAAIAPNPSLCTFDPVALTTVAPNEVLSFFDVPVGLVFAAPTAVTALEFPDTSVPVPLAGCSFCDPGTGAGAIRFDARGQAGFFSTCGVATAPNLGGSLSLVAAEAGGAKVITVRPSGGSRIYDGN
jgi:prepilin-type N-terminal cleavage/methylation domain-containing protein